MRTPAEAYLSIFSLKARRHVRHIFILLDSFPIISTIYKHIYDTQIKRKAVRGLTAMEIEGYNICNLRCVMCPYHKMTREKTLMNMELFKKIIDDAANSGINDIALNFYNEPFADPLIFERIKYVKSKGLACKFSSNGTLVSKEKIETILNSGLDTVIFSFDGATKEAYEKIRVGADFEKTRDNIINLIKEREKRGSEKPSIFVNFVAQKENYHDIKTFRSFWRGLADGVMIGEVDNRKENGLLPDELKKKWQPKHLYPCPRVLNAMEVMSNGQVVLCCMDFDGSVVLGDLNKQTISEIYASAKWEQIRQLHLKGKGDKISVCNKTQCPYIYINGPYIWWGI